MMSIFIKQGTCYFHYRDIKNMRKIAQVDESF